MPTVYEHIKPLQKRAIDFFRSSIWELDGGQPTSAINGLTLKEKFYGEFLVEFGPSLAPWERQYLRGKLDLVRAQRSELTHEVVVLKGILKRLNPCDKCQGSGELRHIVDQDHSEYTPCDLCKGLGSKKEEPSYG